MVKKVRYRIRNLFQKLNEAYRNGFRSMLMLKNIARKPIPEMETYLKYGFVITEHEKHLCPRCKGILNAGPNYQPKYCGECGQKVSFSGIKWKKDKELGYADRRDACESLKNRMV